MRVGFAAIALLSSGALPSAAASAAAALPQVWLCVCVCVCVAMFVRFCVCLCLGVSFWSVRAFNVSSVCMRQHPQICMCLPTRMHSHVLVLLCQLGVSVRL